MLDDLISRRPSQAPDNTETNDRLRRIENLLDHILHDISAMPGTLPRDEAEPSDVSSETSSAIRRYLDRLRDPRRYDTTQLEVPRPVRLHPPSLDAEWAEFLNAPQPVPEQPIQGPPPLIPLTRRAVRIPRIDSISPPPILSPGPRSQSVPFDNRVRIDDVPPMRGRRRRPWIWPRLGEGVRVRPPASEGPSEQEMWMEDGGPGMPIPGVPIQPQRRPPFDEDFLERLRDHRRARRPDAAPDGFFHAGRPLQVCSHYYI